MNRKFYENGEYTTVIDYKFIGYGINSQAVYQKILTVFSIANGIIKENEPQPVKAFYR